MDMREAIEVFGKCRGDAAAFVSSGPAGLMWEIAHRDPTLYFTGMSYAAANGLGLALVRPDLKVAAVEGDGAMVMGLASMATIGRYSPENLVLLILNNGVYKGSFQGELTSAAAHGTNFVSVARAVGITQAAACDTSQDLEQHLGRAMMAKEPSLVVANIDRHRVLNQRRLERRPDRTEFSINFQRALAERHPSDANRDRKIALGSGQAPGLWERQDCGSGQYIYNALKDAGVNFVVYLPDGELYSVMALAEEDPEMLAVCCSREDEGVAIAVGAATAGYLPAVIMEGTGVGLSALVLAHALSVRVPIVLMTSHTEVMAIRLPHNDIACVVNEPILRALKVHTVGLSHLSETRLVTRESVRAAQVLKSPVGIAIPPYVMTEPVPISDR